MFYLDLQSNALTSRQMSNNSQNDWVKLLNNASYSFAIPPEWIPDLARFYGVYVKYNQLHGYLPTEMNTDSLSQNAAKWCFDEFAPTNWTYSDPQNCNGKAICSDCVFYKLMTISPDSLYPYEDCQVNLTLFSKNSVASPLTGFTIDFTDEVAISEMSNQTKYFFFNQSTVKSDWSVSSGIAQYSKLSLLNRVNAFNGDSAVTPYQKITIYPFYNISNPWVLQYPVYNSCYVGNGYNKESQTCYPCSPGYFQKIVDGVPLCLPCPIGTYQGNSGKTFCVACFGNVTTIGTGSNDPNNCLCPPDFYGDGWSSCSRCPSSSSSDLGARTSNRCYCTAGSYGKAYLNQPCFSCLIFNGNDKIAECPLDNMTFPNLDNGWFLRESGTIPGSYDVLKCTPAAACTAGFCSDGYEGHLCGSCVKLQYFRQDLICKKCSGNTWATWVLMLIAIFVVNLAILANSYPSPTKKVAMSITITWVQIIALFAEIPVTWPTSVYGMFQAFGFTNFNLDLFAPECSVELDYWTKWTFKLCLPLIMFGGLLVIFGVQELGAKFFPNFQSLFTRKVFGNFGAAMDVKGEGFSNSENDPYRYSRYVYGPVVMMSILYSFLSSLSFQPLMCVYQSDGTYTMALNSVQKCFDLQWLYRLPQTIFFILLYPVGIPVFLGIVFFKNLDKADSNKFRRYFGGITLSYRSHLFWWEAVDLIRRVSIIMLLKLFFLFQMKFLQLFLAVAVLFIYMVFYVFLQPFKRPEMNFLSSCWMIASIVCLFSGVVFKVSELQEFEKTAFTVVVILVIIFCLVVSVWVFALEFMSHYRILLLQRNRNQDLFTIDEARKRMLEEKFGQMHETLWTEVSYMSLDEQNKFFSDLQQLERVERPLTATSMLDSDDTVDHAPRGIGAPGVSRYRGSIVNLNASASQFRAGKVTGIQLDIGTVSVPMSTESGF
jgi:hypothetical protein